MTPLQFADSLIAAFANSQSGAYFAHFSPDATFLFHTTPGRLENRSDYETLWATWETEDAFQVLDCQSSNRRIQEFGDFAIFTHDVHTTVSVGGKPESSDERETIVLQRTGTKWLATHEHLSAAP